MSIQKYKKKNGWGYRASVQLPNRQQIVRRFGRKLDAEHWEANQKALLNSDPSSFDARRDMTVKQLADYWTENHGRVNKAESSSVRDEAYLRLQILPHFGNRKLSELTPLEVEAWLGTLRSKHDLSSKTCNNALGLLRKLLNDAVRWQFIRYNPIGHVKPLSLVQQDFLFLTESEATNFLSFLRDEYAGFYPVYAAALYTGMRRGELRALKWDCLDFDNRQVTVKRSFCDKAGAIKECTKSKRIRRVPMNRPLFDLFVQLRTNAIGDLVLGGFDYGHSHRQTRRLSRLAGVTEIKFHDLRHSFASIYMMKGGNIHDLKRMLGHSTVQMTERYSHMSPEHLKGKTDILNFEMPMSRNNVIPLRSPSH